MQLIVCCDGTWDDPDDGTHIHRICQAARAALPDPDNVFYEKGVGLEPGMRLSGGALGKGLSENVRGAYRWLVRHYTEWRGGLHLRLLPRGLHRTFAHRVHELRGAPAAARRGLDRGRLRGIPFSPAGAGQHALPRRRRLRTQPGGAHPLSWRVRHRRGARGALGWVKQITADLPHLNLQFHDTRLCGNVDVACQALAIDERRGPFEPTWWEAPAPGTATPEKVLQVWFPGVHSDVGGGYPDKSLAEVALGWMLEQAQDAGLDLAPGLPRWPVRGDPGGPLHDSFSLGWRFAHLLPSVDPYVRPIGTAQREARALPPAPGEKLHWSALARIQRGGYAPPQLVNNGALRQLDLPVFRDRAEARVLDGRPASIDRDVSVTLLDRSASGARIRVEGPLPLLPQVRLQVDDVERLYEVRWRRGRELGLRLAH